MNDIMQGVNVILPCKNEGKALLKLLPELLAIIGPKSIYVIDDGSTDDSVSVCVENGVNVISHPYSKGNGAAIKTGAREATGDIFVFMDADGQHDPSDIPELVMEVRSGFDMVVGARDVGSHASASRRFGNYLYNTFASWMTGAKIRDLTSGFRAVKASRFKEFIFLLPNGFSYPTTVTMAMFRSGYSVGYKDIKAASRVGKSHIKIVRDGVRFLLIIFKVGTMFSPFRIFFPASLFFFFSGVGYYFYTFTEMGRFTNMSALLFINSLLVFLIGLVSEQITALMYRRFD